MLCSMDKGILHIKGFPAELRLKLKLEAVQRGMSLKDVLIEKLSRVTVLPAEPQRIEPEPWHKKPIFKGKEGKLI